MSPPIQSSIDRRAQSIVTEFCVAKGQLVGFVENEWLEVRIARLIRDTILTEHERCIAAMESAPVSTDMSSGANKAARNAIKIAVARVRDLPLAD